MNRNWRDLTKLFTENRPTDSDAFKRGDDERYLTPLPPTLPSFGIDSPVEIPDFLSREWKSMHAIVFIAAGGALGALCRYLAGVLASAAFGPFFPVGTLIVNIAGCFVMGSVYALQPSGMLSEFVLQGFCGALTTFSTFSLDSFRLLQQGYRGKAAVNVLLNMTLGLGAAVAGLSLFHHA